MTHAALKDLENKWRAEAADLMRQARETNYLTTLPAKAEDIIRRADELSATLSAVEGEAEPVAWGRWAEGLPKGSRLMRYDGKPLVDHEPSEYFNVALYTTPPAPQAVGDDYLRGYADGVRDAYNAIPGDVHEKGLEQKHYNAALRNCRNMIRELPAAALAPDYKTDA